VRIYGEDEYFEMLLERAAAIYKGIFNERDRCAKICEAFAKDEELYRLRTPREALENVAAAIRDPRR
jgi:hypothetical protein